MKTFFLIVFLGFLAFKMPTAIAAKPQIIPNSTLTLDNSMNNLIMTEENYDAIVLKHGQAKLDQTLKVYENVGIGLILVKQDQEPGPDVVYSRLLTRLLTDFETQSRLQAAMSMDQIFEIMDILGTESEVTPGFSRSLMLTVGYFHEEDLKNIDFQLNEKRKVMCGNYPKKLFFSFDLQKISYRKHILPARPNGDYRPFYDEIQIFKDRNYDFHAMNLNGNLASFLSAASNENNFEFFEMNINPTIEENFFNYKAEGSGSWQNSPNVKPEQIWPDGLSFYFSQFGDLWGSVDFEKASSSSPIFQKYALKLKDSEEIPVDCILSISE